MSYTNRVMVGNVGVDLNDIRDLIIENNSYKIHLRNGFKLDATKDEISMIRAVLTNEAKAFVARDRKAMQNVNAG